MSYGTESAAKPSDDPRRQSDFQKTAESGYYVQYQDGFQSWSPSKAFEDGYTRI